MIELVFRSDTNQQLAEQELQALGIATERGPHRVLRLGRPEFVGHSELIGEVVAGLGGQIEGD